MGQTIGPLDSYNHHKREHKKYKRLWELAEARFRAAEALIDKQCCLEGIDLINDWQDAIAAYDKALKEYE